MRGSNGGGGGVGGPDYPARIQCWVFVDTQTKRHFNGVSLAGRLRPAYTPSDKTFWIRACKYMACLEGERFLLFIYRKDITIFFETNFNDLMGKIIWNKWSFVFL